MERKPMEERKSWLVGVHPQKTGSLMDLLERINQDPDAELIRTVGPSENPRLLVVKMTETAVKGYRQRHGDTFLFEENAALHQ